MFGNEKLVDVECASCGIKFSMPESVWSRRKQDHKRFFCPNGHSNYYPEQKPTEADRLRERVTSLQERVSEQRDEIRRLREQLIEEGGTPLPRSMRYSWLLVRNGVYTVQAAKALTFDDLLSFERIGPARAKALLAAIEELPEPEGEVVESG